GTLTTNGCGLVTVSGGKYFCFPGGGYQPDTYTYTDPYGNIFTISAEGTLESVRDLNDNLLTIGPNGIMSSEGGLQVPFVRDAQGRITQIADPLGNVYDYEYDAAGDLVSVSLPDLETPIRYTYAPEHLFRTVIDPRGTTIATNSYYPDGRLQSQTDALNHTYHYAYDLTARTTTLTNPDGGIVTSTYDSYGSLLREVDPLRHVTSYTYDANHNQLTKTDGLGHTTHFTYDDKGHRTTVRNAHAETYAQTYNQYGGVTSRTDPLGRQQTVQYDDRFNPRSTSDDLGILGTFEFDGRGMFQVLSNANGHQQSYTHDAYGNLASETDAMGHTKSYTYDSMGRLFSWTDALGHTTRQERDALGYLRAITDTLGQVTRYEYDSAGNRTAIVDPAGHRTEYRYDAGNRLIQVVYPDGTTKQTTYDFRDKPLTEIDQAGRVTRYEYDLVGQLLRVTTAYGTPDAATVQYGYDAAGRQVSITDALSHTITYEYDAVDNLLKVTNPLGQATTYTYDDANQRLSTTDPEGHTTRYRYNARGYQTLVTYADGTTLQQSYDGLGNLLSRTDEAGHTTQFGYDAMNQLTVVTNSLGHPTHYTYDELGNLTAQTDVNGHTTTFAYDPLGRRISRRLPLGMTESYGYDVVGSLIAKTDFNSHTTTYTYDAMNRLTAKIPDPRLAEPAITFSYTRTGQRATMADASGITSYTYDAQECLIRKEAPAGTLSYSYDAAGNLLSIASSNPGGTSVAYTWDAAYRLKTATDQLGTTQYAYNAVGNKLNSIYPNGVQSSYTYNNRNQLTIVSTGYENTPIASYTYSLAPTGHRLGVTELDGRDVSYTYDALHRLTDEVITGSPNGAADGHIQYALDPVGNRLSRTSTLDALPTAASSYDANDRVAGEDYDTNGNLVNSDSTSRRYDFENRLKEFNGGTVRFVYDGDGNLAAMTVLGETTTYLVDDLNPTGYTQVVEELTNGVVQRVFTYGDELISQRQQLAGTWTTSFYGYDGHGSVRMLTTESGRATDQYTYDAFGNLISSSGNTPNAHLYAGERYEANSGSYFLRARYYNPISGRFLSMDPYPGDFSNPLTLHKYLYVHGDPVNNLDPSGLYALSDYTVTKTETSTRAQTTVKPLGFATLCILTFVTTMAFPTDLNLPCGVQRETCENSEYSNFVRCDELPYWYRYYSVEDALDTLKEAVGDWDITAIDSQDANRGSGPCPNPPYVGGQHYDVMGPDWNKREAGVKGATKYYTAIVECKCCDDAYGEAILDTKCGIENPLYRDY
ncbi:MAG: RHS repeat-associated core domain-containing protein, partial [Ardenticatenales bacterium]|nr:RHS repeat-associated core domain-containing protein [Ardenticatenales bacterium]